jgi:hypothetical protein
MHLLSWEQIHETHSSGGSWVCYLFSSPLPLRQRIETDMIIWPGELEATGTEGVIEKMGQRKRGS